MKKISSAHSFIASIVLIITLPCMATVKHWSWEKINPSVNMLHFPPDFIWGVATSAHQVEGNCTNNSWSAWEATGNTAQTSGLACDHWNRYTNDIQLIKSLGVNTYRLSLEWSKIEPAPHVFDEEVLDHYQSVIQELNRNNIKPAITLHHYTDPLWFIAQGGFEKEDNIAFFVEFCAHVFARLHDNVALWFTFNSPCGYALQGYMRGVNPPGKKSMQIAATVYKNVLEAHVQTYQCLKAMPGGQTSRIGILKNIYQLDPYRSWHPLDILACHFGRSLQDDCFFNFFTTGTFQVAIPFFIPWIKVPWLVNVKHVNPLAPHSLDFIGLNYYGHTYMKNFSSCIPTDEEPTDNANYTIYPEGIYRAICTISKKLANPLHIPIYITENGIATDDDAKRNRFYERYLYAINKALEKGHNIKGYITWSLMDNYEWGTFDKHYGLYKVNFTTQDRTLKPGADFFMKVVATAQQHL